MINCRSKRKLPGGIIVLLYLVSCVTESNIPPYAPVYLTDSSKYFLLSPDNIEAPMDGPQQISGTYGKQEFVMDAWVKADQDGIDMALFNSFGAGMGELGFQDGEVSFTSGIFPSSLPGEYIIADFQLCFYKAEAVRKNLAAAGLKFKRELQMEQVEVRGVFAGKKEIIRIEKNAETVKYVNFLRGYSYTLRGDF